jgi:hypothetical protein
MIFNFLKRKNPRATAAAAVQAIEEAILLGHVQEIDDALGRIEDDINFSEDMRYGLEALRYFRAYYGKDGTIEPTDPLQKQKAIVLETAWGSALLDMLKNEYQAIKQA